MLFMDFYALSNRAVLKAIGESLRQSRLQLNQTQTEVADKAGLDRNTLSQLEQGKGATLATLIQVLRALQRLEALEPFNSQPALSPLQLAKLAEAKPKRASRNPTTS
jgi:transcriptional regulator with XRE-family HTH domain